MEREERVTESGGLPLRRRWTGRHYAHLLLPVPYLTEPALAVLDEAVTAADGWRPTGPAAPAGAGLSRCWRRPDAAGALRLAVLGWYPLLVTVGADPAGGRAARRALGRLAEVTRSVDGRLLPDAELPGRLAAAADRGAAAARLRRHAVSVRAELCRRRCPACRSVSDRLATHCGGCGRRFTGTDDERRDAGHRRYRQRLEHLAAELDRLARDRPMRTTDAAVPGSLGDATDVPVDGHAGADLPGHRTDVPEHRVDVSGGAELPEHRSDGSGDHTDRPGVDRPGIERSGVDRPGVGLDVPGGVDSRDAGPGSDPGEPR